MGVSTSKTRLYDLARELKIDTKRLIEEVRREGVDVSVPSNQISKELAEKIREKYFPKKAAQPILEEGLITEPVEEPAGDTSGEEQMISRELLKTEIEKVPENRLEELYHIVRTLSAPGSNGDGRSLMSKLGEITIDGPEDFAENIDLYSTGEKTIG